MGLPLHLFPAYMWELDQLFIPSVFFPWWAWQAGGGGGQQLKIWHQFIFIFNKSFSLKHHGDLLPTGKITSRPEVLLGILEVRWIKPFWVGRTKFPFYELGQQERGQGYIRNKCVHHGHHPHLLGINPRSLWGMLRTHSVLAKKTLHQGVGLFLLGAACTGPLANSAEFFHTPNIIFCMNILA